MHMRTDACSSAISSSERRRRTKLRCAVAVTMGLFLAGTTAAAEPPAATLENLEAAFEADVRAQARYEAFAERADGEGYADVAALFRAAAHAEGVRARSHAEVIRRLRVAPRSPNPTPPSVASTRANLLSTLGQESAERLNTYPRFVQQARRDAVPDAVLSFLLAHRAEESLVRLYQDGLSKLKPARAPAIGFHVCEICGHVVRGDPPERCPVCLSTRASFTFVR